MPTVRPNVLGVLFAVTLVIDVALAASLAMPHSTQNSLLGIYFAQISLCGLWLALGVDRFARRMMIAVLGPLAALASIWHDRSLSLVAVYFYSQTLLVAVFGLIARRRRYRWGEFDMSREAESSRFQFSLGQLLLWMTVLAPLIVMAGKAPQAILVRDWMLVVLPNAAIGVFVAWTARAGGVAFLRLAAAMVATWLVAIVSTPFAPGPFNEWYFWLLMIHGMTLFLWLKVCALAGYPIHRIPAASEKVATTSASTESPGTKLGTGAGDR